MIFRPAILYIDDEQVNLDTFRRAFGSDYLVKTALSGEEALKILETEDFPLIIADQRMPGLSGIQLCEKLVTLKPQSLRMILTAYTETGLLLDAINRGKVHDYIVKPWRKSELKPVIEKAFDDYKNRIVKIEELKSRAATADHLEEEIRAIFDFESLIGAGGGLKNVMATIEKAAPADSTILILGETGTGKELIARAIHASSPRKNGPFVAVHCAALPPTLLESELFGHEKGAFTGADKMRIGRFESAQRGTLFLDEVGEIPEPIQVKLLRVLQEKEIERLGGNQGIKVDTRVVAATNRDLSNDVREGRFREDLFYRLNVIPLRVPPLRDRREDIKPLALYFLKKFSGQTGRDLALTPAAMEHLQKYDWPGNVRELQNIIERAAILAPGVELDVEDLNLNIDEMLKTEKVEIKQAASAGCVRDQIRQKEIGALTDALKKANGNISEAARSMGIARSTLFHRLKKFQLI